MAVSVAAPASTRPLSGAAGAVFSYRLLSYARTWRGSVLSSFVLPLLFVLGFGLSVGSLVDATGRLGTGGTYLAFIAPGMIASTTMQVAFGETSWPVLSGFRWQRTYHAIYAAPVRVGDIIAGDMAFIAFRAVTASTVFLAITAAFGAISSWWALAVPFATILIALAFAAPVSAFSARIDNGNSFSLMYRLIFIPMSLFAGVFFQVSSLPLLLRWLAYISPLYHGVEVCRSLTGGEPLSFGHVALSVAYLAVWAGAGLWLAYRAFQRALSD